MRFESLRLSVPARAFRLRPKADFASFAYFSLVDPLVVGVRVASCVRRAIGKRVCRCHPILDEACFFVWSSAFRRV